MNQHHSSSPSPIMAFLPRIEQSLLLALVIGFTIRFTMGESIVLKIALLGLAITYFFHAYRPSQVPESDGERNGFGALLITLILPKVLWMSSAILLMGIFFYLQRLEGFSMMFLIGVIQIATAVPIVLYAVITNTGNLSGVTPVLLRAVPLLGVAFYLRFL